MSETNNKEPRLLRDRFLRGEEQENLYVTFALYFIIVLLSFMLVFVYLVGMCRVIGTSMTPSLQDGEYVLMLKNPSSFKLGDVVTFNGEIVESGEKVEKSLIKRVIGMGGDELVFSERSDGYVDLYRKANGEDTFELVDNSKFTDGEAEIEDMERRTVSSGKYAGNIAPSLSAENIEKYKFTVDEGYLFVLGDNRNDSQDSRSFGLVDEKYVRGKMFYRLTKDSILERLLLLIYRDDSL